MKLLDEVIEYEALRSGAPPSVGATHSTKSTKPGQTTKGKELRKFKVVGAFAGVGGLERGFEQAGHSSTMLCEFDPAARHVLSRHFPDAEITEDVRALTQLPDCDVLTAGFPCQDLSQVGRRQGISGPNSGLVASLFTLLRQKAEVPQWVILENVPFMLSLDGGRAIRMLTDSLEDMGFSWAYRTINARAFGLPQRRRRVVLLASKIHDPRPVLLGVDAGSPTTMKRGNSACGFYWTEGNTGLGWAIDALPPLKGGSALHIPSPPAIWFPKRHLIATPAIEDAERLQGFEPGWTDISEFDPLGARKRWRMVGNAVSVPMAKWLAERLTIKHIPFDDEAEADDLPANGSYPRAAWGRDGRRRRSAVSEWPVSETPRHLASFLEFSAVPLSRKATQGFRSRLVASSLRYEEAFMADLDHHAETVGAG
ncbi:DNA cytosine methyltransferase [Mesorhizobium caraganae]|uniref:DNA cytosine methyltransferase n=1 Tax=Mesorhizobium caraganae TaxID=483206 RepID=UPI003ECE2A95